MLLKANVFLLSAKFPTPKLSPQPRPVLVLLLLMTLGLELLVYGLYGLVIWGYSHRSTTHCHCGVLPRSKGYSGAL